MVSQHVATIAGYVVTGLFVLDAFVGLFWSPETFKGKGFRLLGVMISVAVYVLLQSNVDDKCA